MRMLASVVIAVVVATSVSAQETVKPLGQPRNKGTQVWMVPAPASDILDLATHPDQWAVSQTRLDVFSFYYLHAYWHPGFECGKPCGPNTFENLMAVVPGGFFQWLNRQGIAIGIEAGAVKEWACTPERVATVAAGPVITAINNVTKSGAAVAYVSMDEPFAAGLAGVGGALGGANGCGLAPDKVANLIKVYTDTIHVTHPETQVGLIEPYPSFSVDQIMSYINELEHAGVQLPYFHLDMDHQRQVREKQNVFSDLRRLRDFCRAKGIPFSVIVWGADGRSNEAYATDAWASLTTSAAAVGVTEHTVFQSWAENPPGDLHSLKSMPDNIPESAPVTHFGIMLRALEFLGIVLAP